MVKDFWMLSVPLHLQLHPCIPPSSSRLMVSVAIQHASCRCIVPCLGALSRAYCKCHKIDCGYCVKWLKLLCTSVVQSRPPPQGPQRYIGRWLGCTPNPNLWTPLTHAFLVMAHLTWRATNVRFFIVPCMRPSCVNQRLVLGCTNCGRPTLLLLPLLLLLLLLLLLTPVLVCLLLLLLVLLTPVVVCGSVASGMQCSLNIPKMLMVNSEMTKHFAPSCKGS